MGYLARMGDRIPFVLAATDHGPMILNRLDYRRLPGGGYVGVGASLLGTGSHEPADVEQLTGLLQGRLQAYGPGVVVIDGGANIGTHTIPWARAMAGWGSIIAIEPQERVFYALAGNIALNNCLNARAELAALGKPDSPNQRIAIPVLDHGAQANFGGLSLVGKGDPGQEAREGTAVVLVAVDHLALVRLDLLKLDVEGMEPEALDGAAETIRRCRPLIFAEIQACGRDEVTKRLPGYRFVPAGMSLLCIHEEDKVLQSIRLLGDV